MIHCAAFQHGSQNAGAEPGLPTAGSRMGACGQQLKQQWRPLVLVGVAGSACRNGCWMRTAVLLHRDTMGILGAALSGHWGGAEEVKAMHAARWRSWRCVSWAHTLRRAF